MNNVLSDSLLGYVSALGSYHHLGDPIAVVVATPRAPAHAAGEELLLVLATRHILAIQVAVQAGIVPPTSEVVKGTVSIKFFVIIPIVRRELHFAMGSKGVPCSSRVLAQHSHGIVILLAAQGKLIELGMPLLPFEILEVDVQLMRFQGSQGAYLLEAQEILSADIPKAIFVLLPIPEEAEIANKPALDHKPAGTSYLILAVNGKGTLFWHFQSVDGILFDF